MPQAEQMGSSSDSDGGGMGSIQEVAKFFFAWFVELLGSAGENHHQGDAAVGIKMPNLAFLFDGDLNQQAFVAGGCDMIRNQASGLQLLGQD